MLRSVSIAALVITLGALVLWVVTGADAYTKYQVVETVTRELDPDDPLVAAGFYDDGPQVETISRDAFRFGLLPTPQGLLDKHLASVATVVAVVWAGPLAMWVRRRL